MKPDITVVVPTHNRRNLLPTTLRAVLGQRGVNLEVVVVDDASADGSAEVVAAVNDPRVRVIRHDRSTGVSTARNHGAAAASSGWLAFCDDDDVWAPDKLARQLAAAMATGRSWSYAGAVRIDIALTVVGGTRPPPPQRLTASLPRWNLMPGGSSNVIVRREAFHAAGGWDPALINLADWDLWARLARQGPPACVAAPLVGYRIHPGNASADVALIVREARLLDRRYGARVHYGELYHYLAWVCLRSGRRRAAARHLILAAAHGNIPAVARTVVDLAWSRGRRMLPGLTPTLDHARGSWIAEAERWLAPLRDASAALPGRTSHDHHSSAALGSKA